MNNDSTHRQINNNNKENMSIKQLLFDKLLIGLFHMCEAHLKQYYYSSLLKLLEAFITKRLIPGKMHFPEQI